jgi:HK97 family phage portal protein
MKREEDKSQEVQTDNPLNSLLAYAPNPAMTAFDLWKFNMGSMLLQGIYLNWAMPSTDGRILELHPVNPAMIRKSWINEDGRTVFQLQVKFRDSKGNEEMSGLREIVGGIDAHYCMYQTSNGADWKSPITSNAESIGLAITAAQHGAKVFKNDATPPMVVTVPGELKEDAAKRLVKSWMDTGSGAKYGLPRILEQGATFDKISMSNEDAQYLETRQFQQEEISGAIFGVPPHLVGNVKQAKGWSTVEQQMKEFVTFSLTPYLVRIEQAVRRDFIPRSDWGSVFGHFNTKAMLRGDIKTRMESYKTLHMLSAISPDEIRTLEDMNPRGDVAGKSYYQPLNTGRQDEQGNVSAPSSATEPTNE